MTGPTTQTSRWLQSNPATSSSTMCCNRSVASGRSLSRGSCDHDRLVTLVQLLGRLAVAVARGGLVFVATQSVTEGPTRAAAEPMATSEPALTRLPTETPLASDAGVASGSEPSALGFAASAPTE